MLHSYVSRPKTHTKTEKQQKDIQKRERNVTTMIQTSVILKEIVRLEVWYIRQQ